MPQVPDTPQEDEAGGDIVVTGPEGDRYRVELPDLGERKPKEPRRRLPGDGLLGR